ncbi:hypothetical protein HAX54_045838 [Datura stramonium]|uniref:Uncharacterized protein n=1 Tax=Datura stramonium TaxID=4076 RepID=A0ABS8WIQ0_DATST|nr:hypothetical protein [Datura stramonium]
MKVNLYCFFPFLFEPIRRKEVAPPTYEYGDPELSNKVTRSGLKPQKGDKIHRLGGNKEQRWNEISNQVRLDSDREKALSSTYFHLKALKERQSKFSQFRSRFRILNRNSQDNNLFLLLGTEFERDAAAKGPESNRASKSVFCSAYGFIPRVRRKSKTEDQSPPYPTLPRTRKSPNPKRLVLGSEGTSSQNPSHEGDDLTLPLNLKETPSPTTQDNDGVIKPNGDGASETGAVDVDPAVNGEEIIKGFMTALATRASGSGKKAPLAEKEVFDTFEEKDLPINESGEKSPQEEPPVTNPPKWDGTPTPSVPAAVAFPAYEDNEFPPNLRHRLSRVLVLDGEAQSTQLVEMDTENPPQVNNDSCSKGSRLGSSKGRIDKWGTWCNVGAIE